MPICKRNKVWIFVSSERPFTCCFAYFAHLNANECVARMRAATAARLARARVEVGSAHAHLYPQPYPSLTQFWEKMNGERSEQRLAPISELPTRDASQEQRFVACALIGARHAHFQSCECPNCVCLLAGLFVCLSVARATNGAFMQSAPTLIKNEYSPSNRRALRVRTKQLRKQRTNAERESARRNWRAKEPNLIDWRIEFCLLPKSIQVSKKSAMLKSN